MCGIAGFIYNGPEREDIIDRMNKRLFHRGPDAGGFWADDRTGVTLGHRRLSIRDLSANGAQPMTSASGRSVIAFNGEIYNVAHIRELIEEASGAHSYRGTSDTEVLLEAIECLGTKKTLDEIKGMFAFAVYDRQEKKLTLARDRYGEKPLYYAFVHGHFVFASEIGAVRCFPGFKDEINRDIIPEYMLLGYIPAPKTIWKGVYKLPPGCAMELNEPFAEKAAKKWRYYDLRKTAADIYEHPFKGSFTEAVDELERLLTASVDSMLAADVPVGTYLSGGIDSACITALAKAVKGEDTSSFTIGFDDPAYDEAPFAKQIVEHIGTKHHEQYVSEAEMKAVIPKIPYIYGEPYADSSQIPTYLVSRMAGENVTVVLSGDAGDELFGGYATYPKMLKLWGGSKNIPYAFRKTAGAFLKGMPAKTAYRAVGMPYFFIRSLEKTLLPSRMAAALLGPKQGIPTASSLSTAPRTSGSSGATTAKSMAFSCAKVVMASRSLAPMPVQTASAAMPPLPGAAKISVARGLFFRLLMMACSRPPPPTTKIFIEFSSL